MTARRHSIALRQLGRETPLVFSGQTVGVMGGSFNPPHQGHRDTAIAALKRLGLDQIWWLVTPGNPLKDATALLPLEERLVAAKKIAGHPRICVTSLEAGLATRFTADTLRHLLQQRPGLHFVWVMGADNLAGFHRWHRWTDIAQSLPIAVIDRPGWRLKAMASPAAQRFRASFVPEAYAATLAHRPPPAWTYLTVPQNPLSSSALRHRSHRQA